MKSLIYLELKRGVFVYAKVSYQCPFAPFCFLLRCILLVLQPTLNFIFIIFEMVTCCGLIAGIFNFLVGHYFGGSHG